MRSYAGEHRTPLAWRHRDMHHPRSRHHRTPSLTTSSSDEREEVPMVRTTPHHHHHHNHLRRPNSRYEHGTLRSTRSVPALALATWDGEPCPVHGHGMMPPLFQPPGNTMRRHGSLFDLRPLFVPPDKRSFHGSTQLLPWYGAPPPPPPPMRPRPFVIPAGLEPLPVRHDPRTHALSKLHDHPYPGGDEEEVCCKGHLVVLWIILAVVTIGVVLGIVLGVTIA